MICCYNAKSNNPYKESHHPRYTKLEKVDDSKILQVGQDEDSRAETQFANLNRDDTSAKSLTEQSS
jgi:hypothetical protein